MTARTRILLVAAAVLVALLVTVLLVRDRTGEAASDGAPTPTPRASPSSAEAPTEAPADGSGQEPPTEAPGEGPAGTADDVVLGLGGSIGDDRLWPPERDVLTDLTAALGPPDATESSTACPDGAARRVHRWDDLSVWVALEPLDPGGTVPGLEPVEPPFVQGWVLAGPEPALRTHDGLAVGATVDELLTIYPDAAPTAEGGAWEVFRGDFSTLRVEATSTEGDGAVTAMVSGAVCPVR